MHSPILEKVEHASCPTLQRFTLDGADDLEERLHRTCSLVLSSVQRVIPPHRLEGLLLGGGYGRGEGGVLRDYSITPSLHHCTFGNDQPYNDLEFYVFVRGNTWLNERRYGPRLHELAEHLTPQAEVEIEFKITSLRKLRRSPPSMFYYDLVMGHRWLAGYEDLLAGCDQHHEAGQIPLSEATRLLMNRCSGLLLAQEQLQVEKFAAENADFVARNIAKAQLALGDAVLTAHRQYHWSCRERAERLAKLQLEAPWVDQLRKHHDDGLDFKLHPHRSTESRDELRYRHHEVTALARQVWLWIENQRLSANFTNVRDYALSNINKCPEASRLRNVLVNLKTFGSLRMLSTRHPRERLFNTLSLLLWEPAAFDDPALLCRLRHQLAAKPHTFSQAVVEYRHLWQRCR